ncbi:MAG: hypothetical protein EZS28_009582 [Streblomastix strix]|uniref:Uncharacterized protein n=1 Tax=Streblomastix strix TaxID=222440 RepID=A0A5J4WKM1_9EUKA|nr:MAG: hypothetical protein EZS28_009582 [Streblomastix strix]
MNPIKQNPTRIASAIPEQQLEKPKDQARRIAQIFRQECISIITKYSVSTMIMRFTIPAIIHNVQFERKIEISQDDGDAALKITKIPILFHSLLLNSLLIFDDIGSNADIQRFSSGLAKTITHLVSDTESGTVWMYDQNWYNSGDIVPDQVTPASDATLLVDSGTRVAGTSNEYSRGDHKHPLQVSDVLPSKDTSVGTVGQASSYARSDHQHPIQTVDTIPVSDSADGSYGTIDSYSRNDHSHPINVQTNSSIVPVVNGVGNNGTSSYYSRHDHIHPQQLTYDGNVTATKFIKSGGLPIEVLCANEDTTTIDSMLSRSYNSSGGGWIRLCNFPANDCVGNPFIEFKINTSYNSVQTIRLQPNYTVNGITNVYGIFNAPTHIGTQYIIENGARQLFHNHSGSGGSAVYSVYIQLESVGSITIVVSDKSTQYTNRITEILTQDVITGVSSGTQIPINYNYGYGGFMQNTLQVNPTYRTKSSYNNVTNYVLNAGSSTSFAGVTSGNIQINPTATSYDDGLRISRSDTETGNATIQLNCCRTSNTGAIVGQWSIFTPPSSSINNPQGFVIAVSSQAGDNSRGLQIRANGNTLTFNGRVL